MSSSKTKTKVSIGMPVYNGEQFITKALDSLLSQTFTDFELIISDNASTDSTPAICEQYAKKDKRIRYARQEKNNEATWNFNFVLQEATCKYFMWAAIDDIWDAHFLEKNVNVLESNKNVVGSISDVKLYGRLSSDSKLRSNDPRSENFINYQFTHPVSGPYEKKVGFYLKFRQGTSIYALYRTDMLRKCMIHQYFPAVDLAVILSILKYGDIHVIDEVLMHRYARGMSKKSIINYMLKQNISILKILFLFFPFTFWCAKHLGIKIFMKNIVNFIQINYNGERRVLLELIRIFKRTICGQERFWTIV